jgi:hypothetical protein
MDGMFWHSEDLDFRIFHWERCEGQKMHQWAFQAKAYFKTLAMIVMDVN